MKQDLNITFVVNTYDGVNVVPINKQNNYLRNGVTYRSQDSYMGLKAEVCCTYSYYVHYIYIYIYIPCLDK